MNKFSMAKISAMVSITLFSILCLTIIIILNVTGGGAIGTAESESTRVGLILNGASDDRSWGQSHYDSLMRISGELNLVVVCRENVPEDERCADVIADLVENEKCSVVIADSYGFGDQIEKAADKYRNIYFFPYGRLRQRKKSLLIFRQNVSVPLFKRYNSRTPDKNKYDRIYCGISDR